MCSARFVRAWDGPADEYVLRTDLSVLVIHSRVIRLTLADSIAAARALGEQAAARQLAVRRSYRRKRWLATSRRPLPRVVSARPRRMADPR